jgi:hypothetical protein
MNADLGPGRWAQLGRLGPPYLGLVVIEFLLGMSLNLFVVLPTGAPASILASSPLLDIHLVVGVLLLGIATNAVRLAARARSGTALVASGVGLVSGVGAFAAGMAFAFGGPSNIASFAMSLGFAGLLVAAGYLMSLRTREIASRAAPRARATEPGEG